MRTILVFNDGSGEVVNTEGFTFDIIKKVKLTYCIDHTTTIVTTKKYLTSG